MGRLLGRLGGGLAYLCVATVFSLALIAAYLWTHGYLDQEKLTRMIEVAQGAQQAPLAVASASGGAASTKSHAAEAGEQPSFDEIERLRGIKARDLELREGAVQNGLDRVRFEQRKLADERDNYERLRLRFETLLEDAHNKTITDGRDNVRLIWENIKPKQAKDQIVQMIDEGQQNEVVAILGGMSINKRAKIIAEFKTEEEVKKFDELLRLIREGVPENLTIDQAREELKKFNPKQPADNKP